MKELAAVLGRYRIVWLLLVTASAVALTNYLFDLNSEAMSGGVCFGLFAAAWLTVLLAWRWHRPYLRRWSGGLTFVVVIAEIFVVSAVRDHLFPCVPPPALPALLLPSTAQEQQYHALRLAVQNNDLSSVQEILLDDDAPDAIVCGTNDVCTIETPTFLAVAKGEHPIVALLLDHGASVTQGDPNLLTQATNKDDVPMMRLLIHHGAPVDDDGVGSSSTVLWDAVLRGNLESVDCLLNAGANPRTQGPSPMDYKTPVYETKKTWPVLRLARYTGNAAIVARLKQAGATD